MQIKQLNAHKPSKMLTITFKINSKLEKEIQSKKSSDKIGQNYLTQNFCSDSLINLLEKFNMEIELDSVKLSLVKAMLILLLSLETKSNLPKNLQINMDLTF